MEPLVDYGGYFKLPNKKEEIQGTLRIDEEGKIVLSIVASWRHIQSVFKDFEAKLNDINNQAPYPIIQGYIRNTESNKSHYQITLVDSSISQANRSGLCSIKLRAEYLITKKTYKSISEIKIQSLFLRFGNLDSWANRSGFTIDSSDNIQHFNTNVKYIQPKPMTLLEDNKMKVYLYFRAKAPFIEPLDEVTITQTAYLNIEFKRKRSFQNVVKLSSKLRDFFSFISIKPIGATQFEYNEHSSNVLKKHKIKYQHGGMVYFQDRAQDRAIDNYETKSRNEYMLITYDDLGKCKERVIKRWMERYEILKPVMNFYFDTLYNPHLYIENEFLNYAFALEVYHRKAINGKDIYYNKRLRELQKINKRLGRELNRNQSLFADKVKNTRNYYAHHNYRGEKGGLIKKKDLFIYANKLRVLLQALILNDLGFDEEYIYHKIKKPITNRLYFDIWK